MAICDEYICDKIVLGFYINSDSHYNSNVDDDVLALVVTFYISLKEL